MFSDLEEKFQERSKKQGVEFATNVETQGVDFRTTKQLGAKEKAMRETCDVLKKNYMKIEVRKLPGMSVVLAQRLK